MDTEPIDDPCIDELGPDTYYLSTLRQGKFEVQHCEECARTIFPPAMICRHCGSTHLVWRPASGTGTVYAVTTVRDRNGNYNVSLIDLEGGARMMSRIDGIAPEEVKIGLRVRAKISGDDEPFIVFTPETADSAPEQAP